MAVAAALAAPAARSHGASAATPATLDPLLTATGTQTSHVYTLSTRHTTVSFTWRLTVTDNLGRSSSTTGTIQVSA